MIARGWEESYFCGMNKVLQKNYKTLLLGGLLTIGLVFLLLRAGVYFYIVNPAQVSTMVYVLVNTLGFVLCWALITFLIHKFSIWKVLGVLGLLIVATVAEQNITVRNNPITIPVLILFWLGVAYLTINEFFKKYQVFILLVYGLVISYYFFVFGTTTDYLVHRKEFSSFMLFPIPVFAVLWIYEQWRWLITLKADKAKAELMLLKSQMNPHFFFNTLNNLYGLVVEKSDQAPEVLLKLSDMMRYTIYEGKEDLVSLSDEIAYLENYIELHKIRYQKKVSIHFTKQMEEDYEIAPLLFINLLENAFKHGVEKMTEGAYVRLNLTAQSNRVTFMIENNFDTTNAQKSNGIGLENLKKRLEHIYPNRHQLEIENQAPVYKVLLTIKL